MSSAPYNAHPGSQRNQPLRPGGGLDKHEQPLHRIALVRRRQGVSLRTVARHWNVEVAKVREQQDENYDLSLSELFQWQKLLNVPVAELLVDCDVPLSAPVLKRAQLVKLMKTAVTIKENSRERSTQRLVRMLIEQLVETMPELAEIGPWHGNGSRRSTSEYGQAASRQISEDLLSSDPD